MVRRLQAAAPDGVEVVDLHERHGVLAVQGPRSDEVLGALGLPHGHGYMSFEAVDWRGTGSWSAAPATPVSAATSCCRGGRTPPRCGTRCSRRAEPFGIRPCGLGARDTLRTEMGYPLHGQDLSMDITPVQARTGWAVGWKKPAFWGRDALLAEKEAGPRRTLWGLEGLERAIPRSHMAVRRPTAPRSAR